MATSTTDQADAAWTYQAPWRPDSHPSQCYYRVMPGVYTHDMATGLSLFRFNTDTTAQLKLSRRMGADNISIEQTLSVAELRVLHAAIGDALQDIAEFEADRERQDSFDRIREELREADELGGPAAYYSHPDIHYVVPGQVEAKVRELEAAGCRRYMVLPDPAVVDASMEGAAA